MSDGFKANLMIEPSFPATTLILVGLFNDTSSINIIIAPQLQPSPWLYIQTMYSEPKQTHSSQDAAFRRLPGLDNCRVAEISTSPHLLAPIAVQDTPKSMQYSNLVVQKKLSYEGVSAERRKESAFASRALMASDREREHP